MMTPGNKIKKHPAENMGFVLFNAYLLFLALTSFFLLLFGFEESIGSPAIIFIMGFNYVPMIFLPYFFSIQSPEGSSFLGLSFSNFKRTLPCGIAVCAIAGIWQSGIFVFPNVAAYPDWAVHLYVTAFPIIILVSYLETLICESKKWIPGFITLILWSCFAFLFPTGDEEMGQAVLDAARNPMQFLLISFLIGIFVPFAEEYFFRGYLLNHLRKNLSLFTSVLITATLFGFAHLGSPTSLSLVLFAIAPGLMALHFKSIYPAVWAHVGLNLSGMILVSTML